jgi:KDO2-lipid IV(A) lauroyltransferase
LAQFFLRLLARLPLPLVHGLGSLLGLISLLRPRHRKLLQENLRLAGLSGQVSLAAVAAGWGRGMAELSAVWLRPLNTVTGWVRDVQGLELLDAARMRGKGTLLLVPHLGCWELAAVWSGARGPTTALYRPPRQPWLHDMMKAGRERGETRTVPSDRSGVKGLLSALKRNETAFILPDQVANKGDGVWANFFGRPVYLPTLPYRLASATGAATLLLVCERLPRGSGYLIRIEDLGTLPEATEQAAAQVHARIEALIRKRPEQYLWSYRIFRQHRRVPPPPEAASETT